MMTFATTKITDKPNSKIINCQLNIKPGQFMEKELNVDLTKIGSRKCLLWWNTSKSMEDKKFDDILLWLCNTVYSQDTKEKWRKGCILAFSKKSDLGISKNYRGLTLTEIATKVYNALKLKKFFGKIRMVFRKINPQLHWFLLSIESWKEYVQKSQGNTIVSRFLQGIWFHT